MIRTLQTRYALPDLAVPLLLLVSLVMNLAAQQFDPTFLRVPIQVDEGLVASSILLELPSRPVGQSLLGFGESDVSLEARAFTELFAALRVGDVAKAASFHRPAPMSATDSVTVATLFQNGFRDTWNNIEVVRVYDLGREKDVVWEVTVDGTRFRRVTRIDSAAAATQDGFWLEEFEPQGLTALQNVLAEAEQLQLEGIAPASAEEAAAKQHHPEAPGILARWHFDGVAASWDAFAEADPAMPDHPVARYFHEACLALKSGDAAAYGSRFTPFSRQRFDEWVAGMPEGEYEAFVASMIEEGRQVQWIMEADPVFLVMFRTSDGRLPYQVIHRNEDGLQLTNFFAEGIFDNLLKDRDFFVRPVLEPLFVSTPAPPPEETSEVDDDGFEPIPRAERTTPAQEPSPAADTADEPLPQPLPRPNLWKPILLGLVILFAAVLLLVLLSKFRR